MSYQQLTDAEAGGAMPTKLQLIELMDERSLEVLATLTNNGGGEKLCALLKSDPHHGISGDTLAERKAAFGANEFAEKRLKSYIELLIDALHDIILQMLIVLAVISYFLETGFGPHPEMAWIEPTAILFSVLIIINLGATIDYNNERSFRNLSKELEASNKKVVTRNGVLVEVEDADIVVGDVLSFNAHMLASIPCDGLLLTSDGNVKMDEAALTGEPEPLVKSVEGPDPWIVSGTSAVAGSGHMLVIAVGSSSVSGKIKAAVYGEGEDEEEGSPLFIKLMDLCEELSKFAFAAAGLCFFAMCYIGFFVKGEPWIAIIEYIITTVTIVAVAVPEGLPLAVTLALAFSSQKMTKEHNLVKHLDGCETMGSVTTICTDKTGTLTANRMTVRAAWVMGSTTKAEGNMSVGVKLAASIGKEARLLIATLISVDSMDESYLEHNVQTNKIDFKGNPTECALLTMARDLGYEYTALRDATEGRSEATREKGHAIMFSSARKMMSWAVAKPNGGYRIYSKGASEIILSRCTNVAVVTEGKLGSNRLSDEKKEELVNTVVNSFASEAMRTIGLAYRDLPEGVRWEETVRSVLNADGSPALACETELTLLSIVGIEDPLRDEVPPAIDRCFAAGIDVRMVTGDNLDTAIAIASRCGILREEHFDSDPTSLTGKVPKQYRAMEGKVFRKMVYRPPTADEKLEGKFEPVFDQAKFDEIWPFLRVMARSSPEDKLTLANGLNKSHLFADTERCKELETYHGIKIFPDRQVVAMTGDGTNDAPALKRADVGFAMGISGTQIAKDACDIVLLDDNFASIVTAAKWGRNVYASIQKFLQFQLTVNIVALTMAITGAFVFQESPIAAVQMLWINLIMDSLASLALATEPPIDALLDRPPVNRSASMIKRQMYFNMIGQGVYQVAICMWILFYGPEYFSVPDGSKYFEETGAPSAHHTILFNCFVMMTLANEINCRKLDGEFNVFAGLLDNMYFCTVMATTFVLQCLCVQLGGRWVKCYVGGLNVEQWFFCLVAASSVLAWQQVVNVSAYLFGDGSSRIGPSGWGGMLKFQTWWGNGKIEFSARFGQTSMKSAKQNEYAKVVGRRLSRGNSGKLGGQPVSRFKTY